MSTVGPANNNKKSDSRHESSETVHGKTYSKSYVMAEGFHRTLDTSAKGVTVEACLDHVRARLATIDMFKRLARPKSPHRYRFDCCPGLQ